MIKRLLLSLVLLITPVIFMSQNFALADSKSQIISGINDANGGASTKSSDLDTTIKTVITLLSVVVGLVAVVMIILAGFRYITSGGSPDKAKSAKNTLLYAVVGLVIVGLAQTISHFVLTQTSK